MFVLRVRYCEDPFAIRRRRIQLASFRKIVCPASLQHHRPLRNLNSRSSSAAFEVVRASLPPYNGDGRCWFRTAEFGPALPSTGLLNNRAGRFSIRRCLFRSGFFARLVLRFPFPMLQEEAFYPSAVLAQFGSGARHRRNSVEIELETFASSRACSALRSRNLIPRELRSSEW